ncbi:MAG: GNAT family N-acetyltransferase [Thermohalobaculum sp.]|nr:GNAT family N-acetyltransferase [Thermohalobaculum sp.]
MNAPAIHPLTPDRLADFEALMGPRGGAEGCWCMLWRLTAAAFKAGKGEANRDAMRARVGAGRPPGLLAYLDGAPSGWISVAPRDEFPRLQGSRILAPIDARPVWSVTCFFIARQARRRGLTVALLDAAARFARDHGAGCLEGYPVDPGGAPYPGTFAWTGLAPAFLAAGFREVARRSDKRPIMRRALDEDDDA